MPRNVPNQEGTTKKQSKPMGHHQKRLPLQSDKVIESPQKDQYQPVISFVACMDTRKEESPPTFGPNSKLIGDQQNRALIWLVYWPLPKFLVWLMCGKTFHQAEFSVQSPSGHAKKNTGTVFVTSKKSGRGVRE